MKKIMKTNKSLLISGIILSLQIYSHEPSHLPSPLAAYCDSEVSKPEEIQPSFASHAALGTDWLITKGQNKPLLKPLTSIAARAVSTAIFPIFSVMDMVYYTGKEINTTRHILLAKDQKEKEFYKNKLRENKDAITRTGLGILTSPASLLSPDLVTHHFVHGKYEPSTVTPYGKLYSMNAHVVYPESSTDVQTIVKEAKNCGMTVSVMGAGLSQGKQAIPSREGNIVINTAKLKSIEIDTETKIAKVGSGVTWSDLQREANQYNLAVRVMQASNIFSIGGSLSVNCHGWDYKAGTLRNTVHSVTIVNAFGDIQKVSPNDALFNFIIGGYGGFGIIVEAEIYLTDNTKLLEIGVEMASSDYIPYFNRCVRNQPDIDMHIYRLSLKPKQLFRTGVAVNYQNRGKECIATELHDEPESGFRSDRIKLHLVRRLNWLRSIAWNQEKATALHPKVASRNEFMRPPINPIFNNSTIDTEWLQEYFVKEEDLPSFLQFLAHILRENNVGLFNASVRFVKHDPDTSLSYAKEGDRFAVVLFFNQKLTKKEITKTRTWVREVIDYLILHGGTFYLPYQHFATHEQFKAAYPEWEAVLAYKKLIDPQNLFDNGLYDEYLTENNDKNSLFRQIFNPASGQRENISAFLKNIFMQLNEEKFFSLMDSILENRTLSDEAIYSHLYKNIVNAKPLLPFRVQNSLYSLNSLKKDLANQTVHLLGEESTIHGYVEIGYPGRMIRRLQDRLKIQDPLYVVHDRERISDYVESGFPRPYDRFISLNDYTPISKEDIPTASVDLVCMYIGLHHIPKEKIDPFLQSIRRILRPGGSFILMDHDAHNKELKTLAHVVHSIFNAGTGVPPKENAKEVRNFHSLHYWIERVKSHGFILYEHEPLVRKGDSTLNSLIRFINPKSKFGYLTSDEICLKKNQMRPQLQTYLTAPEWQNVRSAQSYASFIESHAPYSFPYFKEIGSFWKVYGKSFQIAEQEHGFTNVAFSEYNLMNLFVGTTMTLEYGAKGVISIPMGVVDKVLGKDYEVLKNTAPQQERMRSIKSYGTFIENTPFYQYPYFTDIGNYWQHYISSCTKDRFINNAKNAISGIGMTFEYTLKGLISAPMALFFGSSALKEEETLHLLITDPENKVLHADSRITVLETSLQTGYKHLEVPRYMQFKEIILNMAQTPSIECINIAGHNKIQLDVKLKRSSSLPPFEGCRALYEIPSSIDKEYQSIAVEVYVDKLLAYIRELQRHNIKILFIHDY